MRIRDRVRSAAAAFALAAMVSNAPVWATGASKFVSVEAAYEQGMGAYRNGQLGLAVEAFQDAAARGHLVAQYYLARIYADNNSSLTDHGKAYLLYRRISDELADIDPDDDPRVGIVAKSFTALAQYVRDGLPELNVAPDPARAAEYLGHAATYFNDEDAQFELARMLIAGDGIPAEPKRALDWLAALTKKGHAGAQAFLADLYWRGKHVPHDETRALLLITIAAESAPATERVWIDDIYQNIFCGAGEGVRQQALGSVADWRRKYARAIDSERRTDRSGLAPLEARSERSCSNGERATPMRRGELDRSSASMPRSAGEPPPAAVQGSATGFGLRPASGSAAPAR